MGTIKQTERYIETKAGRIFCTIYESESRNIPLIMIHGGPGATHDYLKPTAKALAEKRTVILYDQLGCGRSDRNTDRSLWTLEYYSNELKEIRNKLSGNNPIHLLGQSWGTMIAVNYLLGRPENICALILSAPCLSSPMWESDQKKNLQMLGETDRLIIRQCEENKSYDNPAYQDAMMRYYRKFLCMIDQWPECMNETFRNMNSDIYSYMWGASEFTVTGTLKGADLANHLNEISIPTLFTCGRYDEATPETTQYYSDRLPGSSVKIFEEASHSHHLEKPDEYIKTINEFLVNYE